MTGRRLAFVVHATRPCRSHDGGGRCCRASSDFVEHERHPRLSQGLKKGPLIGTLTAALPLQSKPRNNSEDARTTIPNSVISAAFPATPEHWEFRGNYTPSSTQKPGKRDTVNWHHPVSLALNRIYSVHLLSAFPWFLRWEEVSKCHNKRFLFGFSWGIVIRTVFFARPGLKIFIF